MFFHHKELAYTVLCDNPNPVFARMLQQAIGGPEGELRVMTQYLFQGWGFRGPKKYRDMLISTGTEEIGHVEVLATAVAMNLEGAKAAVVDDVVTNPAVSARMGAIEPRHFLTTALGATPADANGVPFTASYVDTGGNLVADMRANVAAEAVGRSLAVRLLEMTDDPGMQDMLKFLIARDTMHQQQWLAVLEELPAEVALNAPGDYQNEPEYEQYAYTFFNHLADGQLPADMRPVSGPSLDGRAQFSQAVTPPVAGPEPELQPAPADAHAGPESTAPNGGGVMGQVTGSLRGAIDKITPGS